MTFASMKIVFFLLPLFKYFGCYVNLNFPLTYNVKNENLHLLLLGHLTADILTKAFSEMCVEWCSTKHIFLPKP